MKHNTPDPKSDVKQAPRHLLSRTIPVLLGVISLILAVWLGITLWVPAASENAVFAAVQRLSVPGTIEFSVLSSAAHSARISCTTTDNSFSCNDIRVGFSPWNIRSGEVNEIVLKHAQITPAALTLFDRYFTSDLHADPSFSVACIRFDDCTFTPGGDAAPFAFSGKLVPDPVGKWHILRGDLKSSDDGKTLNLNFEYRALKRELDLSGSVQVRMSFRPIQTAADAILPAFGTKALCGHSPFDVSLQIRDLSLDLNGTDASSCIKQANTAFSAVSGDVCMTDGDCSFDAAAGCLKGTALFAVGKNQPLALQFNASGP